MIRETEHKALSGLAMLVLLLGLQAFVVLAFLQVAARGETAGIVALCLFEVVLTLGFIGLFQVNPNEAKVLQLFGAYTGTVKSPGLRWANPFYSKRRVSLRVRNFETGKLKVNDQRGNPVEIAAVVVWRVFDTAEAIFQVDDYEQFVHVQSEAALRNLATRYPYDSYEEGEFSLRSHTVETSAQLKSEIQDRLAKAGVEVIESRISHLAYASEIAGAMLQRQQANAVVAARQRIVVGAVGMVESALEMLSQKNVVELDEERKAAMVSNLLVILCGDRATQPVVNTGSLYQ